MSVEIKPVLDALHWLSTVDFSALAKAVQGRDVAKAVASGADVVEVLAKHFGITLPPVPISDLDLHAVVNVVENLANVAKKGISSEIATGNLVPDGRGGWVSKEWIADPRHQLNDDGTFKD